MSDLPRFDGSQLMGDEIHIKSGDSFSEIGVHWHSYYELIYYFDADVNGNINGRPIELSSRTLYLLTPFDFHSTVNNRPDSSISFINISFSADALDSEIISKINGVYMLRDVDEDTPIYDIIKLFNSRADVYNKNNKRHLLSVLVSLVTDLGDKLEPERSFAGRTDFLRRVFDYVSENFNHPMTLTEIAEDFRLAPAYFSAQFSKCAGCTFVNYLNDFRLSYAKQLLISTEKTVTQICFDSGFSSLSHFLREFKAKYGVTPSAFRK